LSKGGNKPEALKWLKISKLLESGIDFQDAIEQSSGGPQVVKEGILLLKRDLFDSQLS
jgi:hypothetical protein